VASCRILLALTSDGNLPDDELGFVRKPNVVWEGRLSLEGKDLSYHTDENGFRNVPQIHQADLVFIGDSFTEGASVPEEDTFVQQLGKKVTHSVVNLGRGQYGPQQELIILRRYGLGYNPRVVVWQLFEGNDLSDATRFAEWRQTPVRTESARLAPVGMIFVPSIGGISHSPKEFSRPQDNTNGANVLLYSLLKLDRTF